MKKRHMDENNEMKMTKNEMAKWQPWIPNSCIVMTVCDLNE